MRAVPSFRLAIAAGLLIAALPAFSSAKTITGVTSYTIVARLTGSPSVNNTKGSSPGVDIGGTDLGHMVNHKGKTYFLFGDTFSGETAIERGNWRNNAMSYSRDATPSDGIVFDGWVCANPSNNEAREVIGAGRANGIITNIPTGAVSVNGRVYAWYMAVNHWGDPGQWTVHHAGLARWDGNESHPFSLVSDFSIPGGGNFGMAAAGRRSPLENPADTHVYIWGTPSGRAGGVKLARVAPGSIETLDSYEYFDGLVNGRPTWTADEKSGDQIVNGPVGEMSVIYNKAVGAYTMLSMAGNYLNIRQSPTPWGPWDDPVPVTRVPLPGWYAPYMNPLYVEDDGKTFYFTISNWWTYDVYLAKATLALSGS